MEIALEKLEFNRNRKCITLCPCGKDNSDGKFVPYIGFENKGYCHSCGETFLPFGKFTMPEQLPVYGTKSCEVSFIKEEIALQSMSKYSRNTFYLWLVELFGENTAIDLCKRYRIGSSNHWDNRGANIFWYCDSKGMYHSGKIMLYGKNGRRVKKPFDHCNWVHSVSKLSNFKFIQCFYGEHLLSMPENLDKSIIIVESEKTAIVASVYFPDVLWIACGGATGLTENKCSVLKGRNVVLYPDIGKFELWNGKAEYLRKICASVKVSDYLERQASEEDKQGGFDIADYLIQFPVSNFIASNKKSEEQSNLSIERTYSPEPFSMESFSFPEFELPKKFKCYEKYEGVVL